MQGETAQVITVPVQHSILEIALHARVSDPTALVSLTSFHAEDIIFLTRDVFPIVARISQCRVQNDAPANQLFSQTDVLTIQLDC